jgi:hypothetical protein
MATIYFGNSIDSHHLSVLLIGLLQAIGNRSEQKFTFLCIRILGKGLSLFYVSFFSGLSNMGLVSAICIEFDKQKFISCVFVDLCNKVSCNWKTTWCYLLIITWLFLLQKNLEKFVQDCYDAIALFLCVHLILRYQLMCHKRAVPALDQYWDKIQAVI